MEVNEFMQKLEHPLKAEVEALRNIIKEADPKIAERVKWNAPSYYYQLDMAAFNLRQTKFVQLILLFPKGLIKDPSGLMLGDWKDRREARFANMEEVRTKAPALQKIVQEWLKLVEKER
jgi:Uncharacterized conserved protein